MRSRNLTIAILLFLGFPRLQAQSNGVTLIGHLDHPHGFSANSTQYSACWGWVSPTGREYALISVDSGTSIVDLNGDSLREVQFVPGPISGYIWREMKTYKQYAYIVSEGGWGVQIVDLSGLPDTAVLVKNFTYLGTIFPDSGKNIDRSHTVTLADGYLYCNGSRNWSPEGCVIFSLRGDPTDPVFMGTYEPAYIHDSYVRNDTLFGAAVYGQGLFVADVRDKTHPVTIGQITYAGSGTHNVWASIDGKYAFTTDEVGTTPHDLKVWALDALPSSLKVAEWTAEPTSNIHNVFGRGHYLYVAHYTAGMRVVDVHDPTSPFEAGYYDTYDGPSGGYAGCWGAYPYFPSGKWIGSDMQTGLYVCTFDGLKPRSRPHLLLPPDSVVVDPEPLVLRFSWTAAADQAEDPVHYLLHLSGIDTVFTTTDTVLDIPASLPMNTAYSWYVTVADEFTEVSSVDTFRFTLSPVAVRPQSGTPRSFALKQNFPNPFNPTTAIEFDLPEMSEVTLTVSDLLGRTAAKLLDHTLLPQGKQEVVFDASRLSSGTYFYTIQTPKFRKTRKMVLGK